MKKDVPLPDFERARRHLARRDAVLKSLIRRVGPCTLQCDADGFAVLVRAIVSQQISTHAARAIGGRLREAVGKFQPKRILEASDAVLRGAGLSINKMTSLRDLAEKCISGVVPLKKLPGMEDEEVIERLTEVRGIGRWTAEMFLIFSLGRLDVLPFGDFGLRAGVKNQYALEDLPDKKTLTTIAEPWRPYRSIGTWFLWRSFGPVPQSKSDA